MAIGNCSTDLMKLLTVKTEKKGVNLQEENGQGK